MFRKLSYLVLFLTVVETHLMAQNGKTVFSKDQIHEIRLKFDNEGFWEILKSNFDGVFQSEEDVPYMMASLSFDGQIVDSIGVRLKGFSSYFAANEIKKSLKLDLNEYVSGKKLDGLSKLNLNNGVGDPSFQREYLCYRLLGQMGIAAPRVSFAKLYLNDVFWGVYSIVEQIDKDFLERHFPDNEGDLYKNINWSGLEYHGSDPSSYKSFEKKTNEETSWTNFINLMKVINGSGPNYKKKLEENFHVEEFLKVLAVDVVTSNWDSYLEHGRNWYLYSDTTSKKFHWIPWDYNLAMGGDFNGGDPILPDQTTCLFRPNILYTTKNDSAQLFVFNKNNPSDLTFQWLVNGGLHSEHPDFLLPLKNDFYEIELEVTYSDNGKQCNTKDRAFISSFNSIESCTSLQSNFPHDADDPVVRSVIQSNFVCCDEWTEACENSYINFGGFPVLENVYDLPIYNEEPKKFIGKLMAIPEYKTKYESYLCKILESYFIPDEMLAKANENIALIEPYILQETDSNLPLVNFEYDKSIGNKTSIIPSLHEFIHERRTQLQAQMQFFDIQCQETVVDAIAWHEVVVNELVASNKEGSGISDEKGQFEDWIEIYNNTNRDINLTGYYLSDDKSKINKWAFNDGTIIKAGAYLIVWADEDSSEGVLHANFKLSKSGESLYLTNGSNVYVDSLTFPSLSDLESYSRIPNGTGTFVKKSSTFRADNDKPVSTQDDIAHLFTLYPNPTTLQLYLQMPSIFDLTDLKVTDMSGKLAPFTYTASQNTIDIEVSNMNPGVYFLHLQGKEQAVVLKFVKM